MSKVTFYLLLFLITVSGLLLRRYQFDEWPPFRETSDELHYAWAGVTWLTTGIPQSWSWFSSYTNVERLTIGGQEWNMKQPLIEKPPLYFLASGISVLLSNSRDTYEIRADIIRRLPVLAVAVMSIYYVEKKWLKFFMAAGGLFIAVTLYFGFAYYFDWSLFWKLQQELQRAHALQGLPEMFFNLFRHLIVIGKDRHFLDGSVLLGYLFLFTGPLWLLAKDQQSETSPPNVKHLAFLVFPFAYLVLIIIGESGSTPFTYWGWYAYPFYPFAMITLAMVVAGLWWVPSFLLTILVIAGLGSSAVRFFFLLQPNYQKNWQIALAGIFGMFLVSWLTGRIAMKRLVLLIFIVGVVSINIYTALNVGKMY